MSRPAFAEIDLGALRANYASAKAAHGGRVFAVLKANAYGHGALVCAKALEQEADAFAVAFVEEALPLREAGIRAPILILEGAFDTEDVRLAMQHQLWLVVHQESQICQIRQIHQLNHNHQTSNNGLHVWIKLDTGMHRAGFAPSEFANALESLRECPQIGQISFMTHLACADDLKHPEITRAQIQRFDTAVSGLQGWRSLANSAGISAWDTARRDWGRAGIMLYGAPPCESSISSALRPVMRLKSAVFAQRWIEEGEPVGYGATFTAQRRTRVGLVAMGYADGYPRSTPSGTPVAIDGQISCTIGRVSMDMLTVDLTDLPSTGIGSEVELWGEHVSVNTVAAANRTISYELLCNVQRVQRRVVT